MQIQTCEQNLPDAELPQAKAVPPKKLTNYFPDEVIQARGLRCRLQRLHDRHIDLKQSHYDTIVLICDFIQE